MADNCLRSSVAECACLLWVCVLRQRARLRGLAVPSVPICESFGTSSCTSVSGFTNTWVCVVHETRIVSANSKLVSRRTLLAGGRGPFEEFDKAEKGGSHLLSTPFSTREGLGWSVSAVWPYGFTQRGGHRREKVEVTVRVVPDPLAGSVYKTMQCQSTTRFHATTPFSAGERAARKGHKPDIQARRNPQPITTRVKFSH